MADPMAALAGVKLPWDEMPVLQAAYIQQAAELWNKTLSAGQEGHTPPAPMDRRFSGPDWTANPISAYTAGMYLLNARTMLELADKVSGDERQRQRLRFAVQQWIDAASPSNFLALNPEAQRLAIDTQGESITKGMQHLLDDLRKGQVSQTDETVFEVGRNVATSEGAVVFENHIFQLIEYKPLTDHVYERPLLMVPPCINKFYILDLQPENSLIRYAVAQGHRVFVISWRNADESMATLTWDDYIEDAAIEAIRVVQDITGCEDLNTLGFCIGGTVLACALGVLAARGEQPAASVTLLTTFLDFSDTGVLSVFVDEAMVSMREMSIGKGGLLRGKELATTFSFLRPNDLVWNYVVGNYLKGQAPPPFDLLYWNADSTNLPGPMYCWYLRNTYLENKLVDPGAVTVCGEPLDLGAIEAPFYVYASRDDHIVPWRSAYLNTQAVAGPSRFVLGASGHIAGVINPASKNKRCHWVGEEGQGLPDTADAWLAAARELPGSWWTDWSQWLASNAGRWIPAPADYGNKDHPALEAAPGRYVKQRA